MSSSSTGSIPEGYSINQVVPWGRGYEEYTRYFALGPEDEPRRILDCGGGPSDFTAERHLRGLPGCAADPLYHFPAEEIRRRIAETYPMVMEQAHRYQSAFVWEEFADVEDLGRRRMTTMERFLEDFGTGKTAGRYQAESLPRLPYEDTSFDLALCSHYLFLYSEQVDLETHWVSIREMLRVAPEARLFPLITLRGERSPYVEEILRRAAACGWRAEVERVGYEFQRGGNEMLRILR